MKFLLFFFLFISVNCTAQYTVTGKVYDKNDKKPVSFATVFLNNTSVANATNDDGKFILKNVRPGHYQLLVTFIGYKSYQLNIAVDDNLALPDIELIADNKTLDQVDISTKFRLSPFFEDFKREFLGTTKFAKQCTIINPRVLHFNYNHDQKTLRVYSTQFMQIENDALGYKIKYLLNAFEKDELLGHMYYKGSAYFEEMKGAPAQELQWKQNRIDTYTGSAMQFLRSLVTNSMEKSGFEFKKLYRTENPYYDAKKDNSSTKYIEKIIDSPLYVADITRRTDQNGLFALTCNACLYVRYIKKNDLVSAYEKTIYRPHNMRYAITSVITFNSQYALFDYNGVINNPESVTYEGFFGENRVGNQLPDDFDPTQ